MLSVDTNSLRHLPRRSSKNCDLEFANTDKLKENYSIDKNINKAVLGYWPVSDRIIMMKIQGKSFNIAIVQVYAPTSASTDDEIEEFYNLLESTLDQVKSNEVLVVMGDLNAKVGQERNGNIVGPCGMGEKNERGEKLIEFCQSRKFTITNTWFT